MAAGARGLYRRPPRTYRTIATLRYVDFVIARHRTTTQQPPPANNQTTSLRRRVAYFRIHPPSRAYPQPPGKSSYPPKGSGPRVNWRHTNRSPPATPAAAAAGSLPTRNRLNLRSLPSLLLPWYGVGCNLELLGGFYVSQQAGWELLPPPPMCVLDTSKTLLERTAGARMKGGKIDMSVSYRRRRRRDKCVVR